MAYLQSLLQSLSLRLARATKPLQDITLLALRLVLAYGFFGPALQKWRGLDNVISWFGSSLHLPFPVVNAHLAAGTEALGVMLLTMGLATRLIALPLMFTMVVAVATVHWEHGFQASKNGFEIPLYYFLMLLVLVTFGAGRLSVDWLLRQRRTLIAAGVVVAICLFFVTLTDLPSAIFSEIFG